MKNFLQSKFVLFFALSIIIITGFSFNPTKVSALCYGGDPITGFGADATGGQVSSVFASTSGMTTSVAVVGVSPAVCEGSGSNGHFVPAGWVTAKLINSSGSVVASGNCGSVDTYPNFSISCSINLAGVNPGSYRVKANTHNTYLSSSGISIEIGGTPVNSSAFTLPVATPPICTASVAPISGTTGVTSFSFHGSASGGSGVYSAWNWVFGDGGTGTGRDSSHTYSLKSSPTYAPYLTVTDTNGNSSSPCHTSLVTVVDAPSDMSGNLSVNSAPSPCTIAAGASSCMTNVTLSWEVTNSEASTSAITTSGMPNIVLNTPTPAPNNYSGLSPTTMAVTYPSSNSDFYLYNNNKLLAQTTATAAASCISGTAWDTGTNTCKATIVGDCGRFPAHYTCAAGTSSNNVDGVRAWTWDCNGSGGGANASCSEPKPGCVLPTPSLTAIPSASCVPPGTTTGIINLSWNAPDGATKYTLKDNDAFVSPGPVGAVTSFSHTGLVASSSHSYAIRAESATCFSVFSNPVVAVAPPSCEVAFLPDLTASPVWPTNATKGVSMTFQSTIQNIGREPTDRSFSNFFQVRNVNGTIIDLVPPAYASTTPNPMPELGIGRFATATATSPSYTFYDVGRYSVRACADLPPQSSGVIVESNEDFNYENNNCGPWTDVMVVDGDAPVVTLTANPTIMTLPANSTTLSWSVTNSPTSCTASSIPANVDWDGAKNPTGSPQIVNNLATGLNTFSLVCKNTIGSGAAASASAEVMTTAMSGAINATNCVIDPGKSSCLTNLTWNTIYPVAVSAVTTPSSVTVATGNSDLTIITGAKTYPVTGVSPNGNGTRYFYLYNNNKLLAQTTADASCPATAPWDISSEKCVYSAPGPDLTASISTPNAAVKNIPLTFQATISNIGTLSTGKSFSNFFQVASVPASVVETLPVGDSRISDQAATPMTTLVAGAHNTTTIFHTFSSPGTYSVRACADKTSSVGGGVITEPNENNNCGPWRDVTVTLTPALSCSLTAIPASSMTAPLNGVLLSAMGSNGSGSYSYKFNCTEESFSNPSPTSCNYLTTGDHTAWAQVIDDDGAKATCSAVIMVGSAPAPVDGACGTTHYNCLNETTSILNHSYPSIWTWSCAGLNGGKTLDCPPEKKGPGIIEN
ncbi:MAG: CARDB domain-containing protein [Candidatus Paceibacterota bacterium]|jgi:hypothetical protein